MTPVSVEVLDFTNEAGGLRPLRRVGGQQTRVLALEGRDGRSYSFRGLVKDTSHMLDFFDPMLQQSVVVKLLDDLMSAQHPAGELVASGILDAAEVPSPRWRLVALPDDPALAEFGKEFAGTVGVFGEYPQPAKGSQPGFMGAAEILDHLEFYKRLEAGDAAADTRALLRARLVDLLIGDWDRHRRQWRWAKTNDSPLFTPIPEDRDQAFSRYDGYLLYAPAHATRASRNSVLATRASAASPTTAGTRTIDCWRASRARTSSRRRRTWRLASPTRRSRRRRAGCRPSGTRSTASASFPTCARAATHFPRRPKSTIGSLRVASTST